MDPNGPFQGYSQDTRHYHTEFGRASDSDAPARPPADTIPQWETCGKGNCGNHHRPAARFALGRPMNLHALHCHGCGQPHNIVSLHILPCDHALCRGCLNRAANRLSENIRSGRVDAALTDITLRQEFGEHSASASQAGEIEDEMDDTYMEAWAVAGFTCCGQVMHMEEFMYCLDPEVAMTFWLDHDYVISVIQKREMHFCGWPDCRALVPQYCIFVDLLRYGFEILHCPRCKGNSQFVYNRELDKNVWIPSNVALLGEESS